jgi:4-hydroxy-tetrahydrodipicolinate reductase
MSINILLVGCCGAMGRTITEIVGEDENLKIAAGIDRVKIVSDFPIYNSFEGIKEDVDVIIDFSSRVMLLPLLEYAINNKIPAVLCTTGYTDKDTEAIVEAAKFIPVFRSENMSYGMNVVVKLLEKAAYLLENEFDIEIIEKHHNKKKDSPSGTAKMMVRAINNSLSEKCDLIYGRHGNETQRQEKEIGIHAVRGGTISGEHTAIFAGSDEIIEIKHTALSKKIFASGAVKAAAFMVNKEIGFYDMNSMLQS